MLPQTVEIKKVSLDFIDFHAHVLPRMDHGCSSSSESCEQMRLAKKAGIGTIVATSHFYPHEISIHAFVENRSGAIKRLHEVYGDDKPEIIPAAEVLFCESMQNMDDLEKLCIGDTGYILLEMPFGDWKKSWFGDLAEIYDRMCGKVVLAHVDRYDSDSIEYLLNKGFLAQVNAAAFGMFKSTKNIDRWIDNGSIVALGSDIHGTKTGYKEYLHAAKKLGKRFDVIMSRSADVLNKKF